jgi:hypothetical protein
MADSIREPSEAWKASFARAVGIFSIPWFHAWQNHEARDGLEIRRVAFITAILEEFVTALSRG